MAVADSTEQQLAWEARQRPRAGVAAALAGLLTLGANIWSATAFRGAPRAGFLESLQNVARPGPVGGTQSTRTRAYEFFDAHMAAAIGSSVILAIGLVALGWALSFLAAATRARRPESPRFVAYLPLIGAVLQAVAAVMRSVATSASVSDFVAGPHTVDSAVDVSSSSLLVSAAFIGFVGQFTLAAGIVLVSLHAMRAGLLTRFLGVLGILVGVLQILPIGVLPVAQAFWLLALAALFIGFRPGTGMPPAWTTGRAQPWPSQAALAEQRRAAAEARRGGRRGPAPETPEAARSPAPVGAPARRKRKRKRR